MIEDDPHLKDAQEHYYSAGGLPSQAALPRGELWFWRRAAKQWRARAEIAEKQLSHLAKWVEEQLEYLKRQTGA